MGTNVFLKNNLQTVNPVTILEEPAFTEGFDPIQQPVERGDYLTIINFDRVQGSKKDEVYTFSTVFGVGPVTVTVVNTLIGTRLSSNFTIQVKAEYDGEQIAETSALSDTGTVSCHVAHLSDYGAIDFDIQVKRYSVPLATDDVDITISGTPIEVPTDGSENFGLPYVDPESPNVAKIPLLDVWGEGRTHEDNMTRGFVQAYNLNLRGKVIGSDPNTGAHIPNLLPVDSYDDPKFPLADHSVRYMTMMGSPMIETTAKEMLRTLEKNTGVVFLYNLLPSEIAIWESACEGVLEYKQNAPINTPFNEIEGHEPVMPEDWIRVYGYPGVNEKDEL